MSLLNETHKEWIGNEEPPVAIAISRRDIQKYAAATEQQQAKYLCGYEAPPMFIFNLFSDISELHTMRPDGLARGTAPGPSLPLKRVMAGGTEIRQHKPIVPGQTLTGVRKITDLYEKEGRTGPLIFTVRSLTVTDEQGEIVVEEIQTGIAR